MGINCCCHFHTVSVLISGARSLRGRYKLVPQAWRQAQTGPGLSRDRCPTVKVISECCDLLPPPLPWNTQWEWNKLVINLSVCFYVPLLSWPPWLHCASSAKRPASGYKSVWGEATEGAGSLKEHVPQTSGDWKGSPEREWRIERERFTNKGFLPKDVTSN